MSSLTLSERLRQNLYMKQYLEELGVLLGRAVSPKELGSLEQVNLLREAFGKFDYQSIVSNEIAFAELSADRFKKFIDKLTASNPSPVYVWTPRTIDCGVILAPLLQEINFGFDFSLHEEGIFVFVTKDLCDRLLLDFFESRTGEQRVRLEIQGEHWARMTY